MKVNNRVKIRKILLNKTKKLMLKMILKVKLRKFKTLSEILLKLKSKSKKK